MSELAASLNTANTTKERRVKELKREVEGWREVIVVAQSVLIWEQNWHPVLLWSISSITFFGIWIVDPSLLTSMSFLCMLIMLLEAFVPMLCTTFFNPENWTGNKERQLEDFCRAMVDYRFFIQSHWDNLQQMKTSQPKLYYSMVVMSLGFFAWLGNWNNLFLSYIFVTVLLMVPGLIHHGFLQKYYRSTLLTIASALRSISGGGGDKIKSK